MKPVLRPTLRHLLIGLGTALTLSACGGGTDDIDDYQITDSADIPIANAGSSQSVAVGSKVTLDGSLSVTYSGNLQYQWVLLDKPAGSQATLASATTVRPSFVADVAGRYEADLVVSNGRNSSSHSRVVITAGSTMPIANGPHTQLNALAGSRVRLDGSYSLPPAGGDASALTYHWTVVAPDGSPVPLIDGNTSKPSFIADQEGQYQARLTVGYALKTSEIFTVTIRATLANTPPVALPGGGENGYQGIAGEPVQLDGSQSYDADGDPLQYRWLISAPYRNGMLLEFANPTLEQSNSAKPSFQADIPGTYWLDMYVTDGTTRSPVQEVPITLSKKAGTPNRAPVAVIDDYYPLNEAELFRSGDGSRAASVFVWSKSYDLDGDTLLTQWEWGDTPAKHTKRDLSLYNGSPQLLFYPTTTGTSTGAPVEGYYTVYLTVSDGKETSQRVSQTIHVRTGANRRPVAQISANVDKVMVNQEAWFTADGSTDADSGTVGMTYEWLWRDKPAGSQATFLQPGAERTRFIADVAGVYTAELIVRDNTGTPSKRSEWGEPPRTATIVAKNTNHEPSTSLSTNATYDTNLNSYSYVMDRSVVPANCEDAHQDLRPIGYVNALVVNANGYDPDGDVLYYDISLQQPSGSRFPLSYTGQTDPQGRVSLSLCGLSVPGDYTFSLQMSDGSSTTATESQTVTVTNMPDTARMLLLEAAYGADGFRTLKGEASKENFNITARLDLEGGAPGTGYYEPSAGILKDYEAIKDGYTFRYFRLTAIGQDYSFNNIRAVTSRFQANPDNNHIGDYAEDFAGAASHQPSFIGLPPLLKAGESVIFGLRQPVLPARPQQRPQDWIDGQQCDLYLFSWSFEVANLYHPDEASGLGRPAGRFEENIGACVPPIGYEE